MSSSGSHCYLDTSALQSGRTVVRTLFLNQGARAAPANVFRPKILVWCIVVAVSVRVLALIVCSSGRSSLIRTAKGVVSLAVVGLRHHLDRSDQGTIAADACKVTTSRTRSQEGSAKRKFAIKMKKAAMLLRIKSSER